MNVNNTDNKKSSDVDVVEISSDDQVRDLSKKTRDLAVTPLPEKINVEPVTPKSVVTKISDNLQTPNCKPIIPATPRHALSFLASLSGKVFFIFHMFYCLCAVSFIH